MSRLSTVVYAVIVSAFLKRGETGIYAEHDDGGPRNPTRQRVTNQRSEVTGDVSQSHEHG